MRSIVVICISLSLSSLCSGQSVTRPVQQYNNGLVNNGASVRPGILTLQYTFKTHPIESNLQYTHPLSAVIYNDSEQTITVPQQFPPVVAHVQSRPHYEVHHGHQELHHNHLEYLDALKKQHHIQHEPRQSKLKQHHLSQGFPYQPLRSYYTYNPPRSHIIHDPQVYTAYFQPHQDFNGNYQQQSQFSSYSTY